MNILRHLGAHFGSLGSPFGLILPLLGHFLASFLALLGRRGASWNVFWAQVGPSRPKMPKRTSIFGFTFRSWHQVGTQKSRKIDAENDFILRCIFNIDFY